MPVKWATSGLYGELELPQWRWDATGAAITWAADSKARGAALEDLRLGKGLTHNQSSQEASNQFIKTGGMLRSLKLNVQSHQAIKQRMQWINGSNNQTISRSAAQVVPLAKGLLAFIWILCAFCARSWTPVLTKKKRCIINHRFPFLRGTLGKGKLTSRWHHDSIIIVTPNKILSTCSGNPPRKMEKKKHIQKKDRSGDVLYSLHPLHPWFSWNQNQIYKLRGKKPRVLK